MMEWLTVIVALLAILFIREIKPWLLGLVRLLQQLLAGPGLVKEDAAGSDEIILGRDKSALRSGAWNTETGVHDVATLGVSTDRSTPPARLSEIRRQPTPVEAFTDPFRVGREVFHMSKEASVFPTSQGFLNHAHDLVLYHPIMNNINGTEEQVLKWVAGYTLSGAEFDASDHVPGCHAGTRILILEKLYRWINDAWHPYRMLWLHGGAGVGKSAIVQSLAEHLSAISKLGATIFFSRPNKRNKSIPAVPTIAYQLAVKIPPYRDYLRQIMIEDPKLLEKDMEHQFSTLITQPFAKMQSMTGWVVLLDGLDECDGEGAQTLLVKLISQFTLQYPTAPLVWVIASRPEAHLQLVFSSTEIRGSFEEYDIPSDSDDARRDVEKFLRARFAEIHQTYRDLIPPDVPWPGEQDITRISGTSSGFFALAATVTRYIEDPNICDPISQLTAVLSVTEGLEPGSLSALYAFYSAILDRVPRSMSSILRILLSFYTTIGTAFLFPAYPDERPGGSLPLVIVATMFGLQQHTVYGALRKLHSVVKIPPLDESGLQGISFYHASFSDYLRVRGDYTLDTSAATRMWWNWFAMLSEGDYTAYSNVVSDGHLSVSLSWDVRVNYSPLSQLLWDGLALLIHLMTPGCLCPRHWDFGHPHALLTGTEMQCVFSKIDFSAFPPWCYLLGAELIVLFNWLPGDAPSELMNSGLVKTISSADIDRDCIAGTKEAHRFIWSDLGQSQIDITMTTFLCEANAKDTLVSLLEKLRSDDPEIEVLVLGEEPSKSCALINVEGRIEGGGILYFLAYPDPHPSI